MWSKLEGDGLDGFNNDEINIRVQDGISAPMSCLRYACLSEFHVVRKAHTCDSERDGVALRGLQALVRNVDVVGAGVVSLVAVVCLRKLEISGHHVVRVIGGWLGVVRMIGG